MCISKENIYNKEDMGGGVFCIYYLHAADNLKVTWFQIVETYLSGGKMHWQNGLTLRLSCIYVSRQKNFY